MAALNGTDLPGCGPASNLICDVAGSLPSRQRRAFIGAGGFAVGASGEWALFDRGLDRFPTDADARNDDVVETGSY